MILHVAATLERLVTVLGCTFKIFGSMVDSLDMVLEVVWCIGRKCTVFASLPLQVLMRQLVLAQQELCVVALWTLIALESLFSERVLRTVFQRAMPFKIHNIGVRLITRWALILVFTIVRVQMRNEPILRSKLGSTFVALERHIGLLWNVDWPERKLRKCHRQFTLDDSST